MHPFTFSIIIKMRSTLWNWTQETDLFEANENIIVDHPITTDQRSEFFLTRQSSPLLCQLINKTNHSLKVKRFYSVSSSLVGVEGVEDNSQSSNSQDNVEGHTNFSNRLHVTCIFFIALYYAIMIRDVLIVIHYLFRSSRQPGKMKETRNP